jgi:hypothetical protein
VGSGWHDPTFEHQHADLRVRLKAGTCITFAHCGLAYYRNSAFVGVTRSVTEFPPSHFPDIRNLPKTSVLPGSGCPAPIFEPAANIDDHMRSLGAIIAGDLDRIVVPRCTLPHAFPSNQMFRNAIHFPLSR